MIEGAASCVECESNSYFDEGPEPLLLHEPTCSKYKGAIKKYDEITEPKKRQNKTQRRKVMTEEEKMKQENHTLRRKFDGLMEVVSNSLITIDWVFKLGLAVAVWFFPIAQDRWIQSLGFLGYIVILTLISKAIVKVKSYRLDD